MEMENNVKVAVRIRPQVPKEVIEMCSICTTVTPNEPQIWLGKDKAFTFDHVFDQQTEQAHVYESCVKTLVEGCLEGYNATVVAYGQTGSGKTYTMGTGFDLEGKPTEKGIIPRAVEHLFAGIRKRQSEALDNGTPVPEFKINAQFLELYNEDIIDLLADERTKHSQIKVHEDANGGIYTVGAASKTVTTVDATLQCLKKGSLSRSTASTQMNTQSSRSHAIFTLHIKQQRVVTISLPASSENEIESESTPINGESEQEQEFETLTAKFHFVDLAGSERLKRTGATGDRQKEGISINSGLLALGNVISALGDKAKRALHVPYRDSKLTRLLQDSLGGNSRTLMIACISPSDRDFMETLNTLRYANRAKNIKNRVMANQDKSSQTIMALRREIQQLQLELMEYKQGKRVIGEDGSEQINDMYHENTMLQQTINNLNTRLKALQDTNERLISRNSELLVEKESGNWVCSGDSKSDISEIIHGYVHQIEDLRSKLIEMEETCSQLRKQLQKHQNRITMSPYSTAAIAITGHYDIGPDVEPSSVEEVLGEAKKDVMKMKKASRSLNLKYKDAENQDTNGNDIADDNTSINGDEADNETEESSEEDSDEENKENNENELELVELTNEISVKEKLIMELEKSQRKLNTMKQQYEDKLLQLQNKISAIESERDQVLSKLSASGGQPNEKEAKKIRADYEKKIAALQSEMKKLQLAKKQHAQAMKNQVQHEMQLKQLKNEVSEMKKQKVRLLNKMKEEAQKHREAELRNTKKIAQLTKQERAKDVKIKNLEVEKSRARQLLKRKDDEVNALKRRIKPFSDKVAGRVVHTPRSRGSAPKAVSFSPKVAKQKWQRLEQSISRLVLSKQSIAVHEKRMERFLHQRDQVSHALDKAMKKLQTLTKSGREDAEVQELYEEIDNHESHINYLNQNINECQSAIVQIEDTKDDSDIADVNTFLNSAASEDMKYLFEKLLAMAISQSLLASQKEEEKKEFELRYKQSIDNSLLQESLLHHVLETTFLEESGMFSEEHNPTEYIDNKDPPKVHQADLTFKSEKARRRTRTPQELLFLEDSRPNVDTREDPMTKSLINPMSFGTTELHRVPSAPSLKENEGKSRLEASPATRRKNERNQLQEFRRFPKSTSLSVAGNSNSNAPQSYASRQLSMDLSDTTPPASPPASRRNRDDNVFSRLTSGTNTNVPSNPDRGIIIPYTGKAHDKNSPLVCAHVAEGHSRPVLSVTATNDVMFSGSKDCTAKIWDLHTGREIQSLSEHPDSVIVVRYNEYNRLAFSVSKSIIKVWDPRDNPARCIKILNSSGLASSSMQPTGAPHKGEPASGEHRILDVQLSLYGTTLFSTSSNIVRVWDLRMFYCVGKLNTGHQAPIMCMCVEETGVDNNLVATGSKDHYIKVFEVMEGVGGIHNPKMTCTPPHYDGIEALAITGDFLFSASRDACIKKWDLSRPSQKLVQSVNQAHKDWIQALGVSSINGMLVSGCRSGYIKLWSVENCQLRSDIKAHTNAIHSIDTNMSLVFTASADNTIGLWRWKTSSDPSPDFNDANYNDL